MAWQIIGPDHRITTIEALVAEYPDLVAYDESGFGIPLSDFDDGEALADAGYCRRDTRRILLWACEADSEMDDGAKAIAEARWSED